MIRHIFKRKDEMTISLGYGILDNIDEYVSAFNFDKIFIITSKSVYKLWKSRILGLTEKYSCKVIVIKSNEKFKNLNATINLYDRLLKEGATKKSLIISFGGGVVTDIIGFVSSTIFRGIRLINIPTTLMSQLECAVGIKYGINTKYGKNCIGSFYCPSLVLIDFELLSTSSSRDIKSGIAEGIKYALCYNKNILKKLFKIEGVKSNDFYNLITEIIKLKINKGNAAVSLMYGHELGHALEILSDFSLTHGEAVSMGMAFSAYLSNCFGFLSNDELKVHVDILKKWDLPVKIPSAIKTNGIADCLFARANDGKIKLIILKNISKVKRKYLELDRSEFLSLLNKYRQIKWKN